jgi:TPR repeat protein
MDPEARRRACVAFRAKLSRDTGVNLPAAVCEGLLDTTYEECEGGEQVSLQSNPGHFYTCLGAAIADQDITLVLPDHEKVASWCYREAAEVYTHPRGMGRLARCYDNGWGVTKNPAQAAVWFQ